MKKAVSYKQLFKFKEVGSTFLTKFEGKEESKLSASIKSVFKQIRKDELFENYADLVHENNITHCSVDEKTKNVLKDVNGEFVFTQDALRNLNKANRDLQKTTVEIHQRILPENDAMVSTLSDLEIEAFSGIVITEIDSE